MRTLRIKTSKVYQPLLEDWRYKAAYGGRASGKSHFFAEHLVESHLYTPGLRSACLRETQRSLRESVKLLIQDKIRDFGLTERDGFKVYKEVIETPGDGLILFRGLSDFTAESIKSLADFNIGWVEEAQTVTAHSLMLFRPTIRGPGAQKWFSWNPRRKNDPVDMMFRTLEPPSGSCIVRANWRDNAFFAADSDQERLDCLNTTPEMYEHIWEGDYEKVFSGAYWAKNITEARNAGRFGVLAPDPLMTFRAFVDIGGTGAKADAFSMWIAQFIGKQICVLNYYEAVGQPLATHLAWLRKHGYASDNTQIWLPHDGATQDKVFDVSYESALKKAGYEVTVIPNQGRGAAAARIEAVRRIFPNIWMDEAKVEKHGGLSAIGSYHEKRDEARDIGLGPNHDWSSHAADAFGLMAVVYEKDTKPKVIKPNDPYRAFRRKRYGP